MSRCPFPRRGLFAALTALLVTAVAGCPGGTSAPTPTNRPAAAESGKSAKENGTTPRLTAPEHIPGG